MNNDLDVIQLQLVDFFINQCHYHPFAVPKEEKGERQTVAYLYNPNAKNYQIICIERASQYYTGSNNVKRRYLNLIKQKINSEVKANRVKVSVLSIFINQGTSTVVQNHNQLLLVVQPSTIIDQLSKIFPLIKNYEFNSNLDPGNENFINQSLWTRGSETKSRTNEVYEHGKGGAPGLYLSSKDFLQRTGKISYSTAWGIVAFVIILAIAAFIASSIAKDSIFYLIGADSKHLVYSTNSFWRFISYPFLVNFSSGNWFSIIFIVIEAYIIYIVTKPMEAFFGGWRIIATLVVGTIITGFVGTLFWSDMVLSGFSYLIWMGLGMTIYISFANHEVYAAHFSRRLFLPYFWLILEFLFFNGDLRLFFPIILALVCGIGMALLLSPNRFDWNFNRIVTPVLLAIVLLVGIIGQTTSNSLPFQSDNNITINYYMRLENSGVVSKGTTKNVCETYFHGYFNQNAFKNKDPFHICLSYDPNKT